ncbi:MAG: hypothetical protein ACI8YQ_003262 [Polaribacter sp.]|jgi:hypothetical protein
MKNNLAVLFLCTVLPQLLLGQNSELTIILGKLTTSIQTVEAKKYSYGQELTWDEEYPNKVNFEAIRTGPKGKSTTMELFFNLQDIDKQTIKRSKVKDLLVVRAYINNKNKYIKTFQDGEKDKYASQVEIIANDVDNARQIEELLKKAIPLAAKVAEANPLPTDFENQMNWLLANIVDAEKGTDMVTQSVAKEEGFSSRLSFSAEWEAKRGSTTEQWFLNLIDLDDRKIELKVDKKALYVNVLTKQKKKYIRYLKNGALDNYSSGFKIYAKDIETGKSIAEVIKMLVINSREKQKNIATKGSLALAELVKTTTENDKQFEQEISGDCIVTLSSTSEKKGESIQHHFKVNLADLDPKSVNLQVAKKTIWVKTKTLKKAKYVEKRKGEELEKFESEFSIRATDIENARLLLNSITAAIKSCEGKSDCADNINGNMDEVAKRVAEINNSSSTIEQSLERVEDSPGQWKFIRTEKKSKGDKEESWIFNIDDINKKKIDFSISKNNLVIKIQTNQKESIIKYYKDSEPDGYKNEMEWRVKDIESARALVCILRAVVKE